MDREIVIERLAALRRWMGENGVRAFVVRNVSNIAWLTGFEGVFDEEKAHTMVVTADDVSLLTDVRYVTAIRNQAVRLGNLIKINGEGGSMSAFVKNKVAVPMARIAADDEALDEAAREAAEAQAKAAAAALAAKPFAVEDDITLAEYRALEKIVEDGAPAPAETNQVIRGLRAVKTEAELAIMRRAQEITDAAFEHMKEYVKPGMTEMDVRIELEDFMMWSGAESVAFASIVAAGPNSAKPHAVPGQAKLMAGQVLLMDFGAKFRGYRSDMTRCLFLGQPLPAVKHLFGVVREANEAVEAMLKPGVTGAEAQALAEQIIAKGGYAGMMGHGLGHGVGIDIHEEPFLNGRNQQPLVAGNVVTVEPGIYLPEGRKNRINIPMTGMTEVMLVPPMGIRLEDCGVITEDGFDVFTQSTHELVVI